MLAEATDHVRHLWPPARLDRDIGLRIQAKRAVAEVGAADAQHALIHDHQLRVHVEAAALRQPRHVRVVDVKAPMAVGFAQPLDQARAQDVHGVLFEPAVREEPQHEDDLRPVGLG